MSHSYKLRILLMIFPICLLALCEFTINQFPELRSFSEVRIFCKYLILFLPPTFAVTASLTEPNNSKSWQIISTVLIYFIIQYAIKQYIPHFKESNHVVAFTSAFITATFCSHMTANNKYIKRYLSSRFYNLGVLLIVSFFIIITFVYLNSVAQNLLLNTNSSNPLFKLPYSIRSFVLYIMYGFAQPFKLEHNVLNYIVNEPRSNAFHIESFIKVFSFCTQSYGLSAMIIALYLLKKKTILLLLLLINIFGCNLPYIQEYTLIALLWLWPYLIILYVLLSSLLFVITEYIGITNIFSSYTFINISFFSKNLIIQGIILFIVYLLTSIYIFKRFDITKHTLRLPKRKTINIKRIIDDENSSDQSLGAIRIIKIIGGLDNFVFVKNEETKIVIKYLENKKINNDGLKSFGRKSFNQINNKIIVIYTDDILIAKNIVGKILTFAQRQFLDISQN